MRILSRPSRGAWIEMFSLFLRLFICTGRAPRGARGLKFDFYEQQPILLVLSRPSRGAWIEIFTVLLRNLCGSCRAPRGARGLKFFNLTNNYGYSEVAPLAGRVD